MIQPLLTHPAFQSRIFFCLLWTVLLSAPASLSLAGSLKVSSTSGERLEAAPGKLLTLSFSVTNTTATKKRFESSVIPPKGWRRLAKDVPFELEGGASDIRLLSISVPAEAPASDYVLRYGVRDASNPADSAQISITIVIAAVTEQGLKLVDSPRLVVSGDPYVSIFLLSNKGNVASTVKLSSRSSNGFPATADSAVIHLKSGESRTISVRVKTDPALLSKVQDVLDLTAELDPKTSVRASSYVEVVPRVTGVEERFVRFPILTKVRFAGEQGKNGGQVEVAGSGPLGSGRDDRLDILLRTPDIQQKSILAQRDEYRVSYTTKSYDVYLGDKNYSLSPLTEYNRYGFGASGGMTLKNVAVGGFYNETRFYSPAQKEWAGFVNYLFRDVGQIGINYLGKQDQKASDIVSLRGLFTPNKTNQIDLEYGVGQTSSGRDDAYAARWSGRGTWIAYDARYVRAGSNYPGYFKDLELKNVNLNLTPFKEFRIEGYYRDEQRNLQRDSTLQMAPRDRYYQVGVGLANLFAVYYKTNDQDDLLPIPQYQRREESWEFRAGFSRSTTTLLANADIGSTLDQLAGIRNPFRRYNFFASFEPIAGQTFGFSAEYTDERDPTTFEPLRRLAGSVNVTLLLGESTQFAFSLYGNRTQGPLEQTYSLIDVSFDQVLPWGHILVLRGRQSMFTPSIEGKEIAYLAEYSIPIGVPIARSTVSGQLVGRVVDSEKGIGLQNVLVYAGGATALTDRNGNYFFPSLKPDTYVVQLDMASVGLNRVSLQQLPHEVAIVGGQVSRFDISLSRSVSVSGTVVIYGAKEQAANDTTQPVLVELGGHPNVVLELSNSEQINRRITDTRGRYLFSGIRPGRWTLRIIDGNLPQNYSFERDSYEINVGPGKSVEQTFKVLPRRRRIQIVQQGKTIEAAPQKGKIVEAAPPRIKPAVTVPPKEVGVEKAPGPELKKPAIVSQQVLAGGAQPQCTVVFVPGKLRFSIEHSTWETKATADSVAAQLVKISGLPSYVDIVDSGVGKTSFRVLIGYFNSRAVADAACLKVKPLVQ